MSESKKVSLRYFTGTGNSRRIAEVCSAAFAEAGWTTEIASITDGTPPAPDAHAVGIVFPVYSLDLPRIAKKYLESLPRVEGKPALLLVTGGNADDCGWSLLEGRRILEKGGWDLAYADLVRMPNNWGPFMRVPSGDEASAMLAAGEAKAKASALAFIAGERYVKPLSLPVFGPLGSRLVRQGFKLGVKRLWTKFRTSEACTSCGLCARSCPMGSIEMIAGRPGRGARPRWSASCEQCMRCFNACPSRAILQLEAIGHGSRRERYLEPHFRPGQAIR
jgi:ferredoxin